MRKKESFYKLILIIPAMAISILCPVLGFICFPAFRFGLPVCLIFVILLIGIAIGNHLWSKSYIKKIKETPVKDQMDAILTRHQNAQSSLEEAIIRLKRIQTNILLYFLLLALLACALAFFSGPMEDSYIFPIISFYILYGVFFCLSPIPEEYDDTLYVSEEEYPYLYKIAYKAMHDLNMTGTVKIMILPDWNAGIAKMKKFFSLQLGAEMLYMLTEEELYHVLLHEFGHLADPYSREYLTPSYMTRFCCGELSSSTAALTHFLITGPLSYYNYESEIFDLTTSKHMEQRADMKACTIGTAPVYAAALTKMALHEYFDFESGNYLTEPYYAPTQPRDNVTTMTTQAFSKALEERMDSWLAMLARQLPPLMDSHPSYIERYASIGKPEYTLVFPNAHKNLADVTAASQDNPYIADCKKAIKRSNKMIYDQLCENYEEERQEHYLKPLKVIETWQEEGRSIHTPNIADVIKAMDALNQYEEAEALCDRIISESENVYMTAFPLLYKGSRMLHRYDKEGIERIYTSIDLNPNMISTGLDLIGSFCQHMGLKEELEEYRKRVPAYAQTETDFNDGSGDIKKTDHLIPEHFPDNRLEEILNHMTAAGKRSIDKIYLVRKVVNADRFYSIFIIKWKPDTAPEFLSEGMDNIFNYLDTYPDGWPYSLFLWDKNLGKIVEKVDNTLVYDDSFRA